MLAGAADRVVDHGAGLDDEGPVRALGEEQLARGLVERAAGDAARVVVDARQLDHPLGGLVQVAVDPVVDFVEPHRRVAARAPRGERRLRELLLGVLGEVVDRRLELEHVLIAGGLADEEVEEHRPLVPPVAVELGVVGADHDRHRAALCESFPQVFDLLGAVEEEVARMQLGAGAGRGRIVRLLCAQLDLAGDAEVLHAGVLPVAGRLDVRLDVLVIEVPADVAVELAVDRIARIAVLRTPHLHRTLRIAGERGHAGGRVDRRVHAAARTRHRVGERVRVDEEEADVLGRQVLVDPRRVPAFGQPDAARIAAEVHPVVRAGHLDLRADGLGMDHQRQKAVGRATGDDLEGAGVLETLEAAHQIAAVAIVEQAPQMIVALAVVPGERAEVRIAARAVDFLVAELAERVEPLGVARHEQLVAQHADQRRRQGHRDAEGDAVFHALVEDFEERKVRLGDGFVEPVFLEEFGIFRMPHVRQVGVQHDGEGAPHFLPLSTSGTCVAHGSVPPGLPPKKLDPSNPRGCSRRSQPAGAAPP